MRASLTIFALLGLIGTAARADDRCWVPMADWQPREAVKRLAAEQGWQVRRIKIDDGCYEVVGRDAEGRAIEVRLNPATLEVLELEFEAEHDDHSDHTEEYHDDGPAPGVQVPGAEPNDDGKDDDND